MKKENENPTPAQHSIEPGQPDFNPGHTGIPDVDVLDEDAKAEQVHEKNQPKQETDDEDQKLVNEQEQDQVVNDDETPAENADGPKKMSDKV